ncbi:MAG: riboflavin biosynthesis protein RibF [Marinilabiliaceae bacterium]|nr:riboflavin biosynthesis protein RibF [Marinilabiliaceae bacterium]
MFDGLHTGHRELLNHTIKKAKAVGGESVVLTFWPHPRLVLQKDDESLRFLTSLEEKTVMLSNMGVDHLIIIPFSIEFSKITSIEFIENILVKTIRLHHLVIGFNHRFGSDGYKNSIDYEKTGVLFNFGVTQLEPIKVDNHKSGSTLIRSLLLKGDIQLANKILGYNYRVTGRVVGGQQLGRTINYPTANVEIEEYAKLIPLNGVYACKIIVLGEMFYGMLNIGYRPTISSQKDHRFIEVHIFDFSNDIYSEEIVIEFVERIRNEERFSTIEALKKQLMLDEFKVRELLDLK